MGVLTRKGRDKNRRSPVEKLRFFDLIICVVWVGIKGFAQVDLNSLLLDPQPVAGSLQNGRFDALGVQLAGGRKAVMLE